MMRDMKNKLSIAVVTSNRCQVLDECLESLFKSTYPFHEVMVIDNASTDGTATMLRDKYPSVRHIVNSRNFGLTYCHVMAMKIFSGDCIFLLDDDNELRWRDTLDRLVSHLYSSAHIGIVVPTIGTDQIGFSMEGCRTSMWTGKTVPSSEVCYPLLCFWKDTKRVPNSTLIKRECIESCGYLDDRYFSTLADEDYVMEMNKKGMVAHVVLGAKIYHKVSHKASWVRIAGLTNPVRAYICVRNRSILIIKHAEWYQLLVYLAIWFPYHVATYGAIVLLGVRKWEFIRAFALGVLDTLAYLLFRKMPGLGHILQLMGDTK